MTANTTQRVDVERLSELLAVMASSNPDRLADYPGGCDCHECGCIFIGGDGHDYCAQCEAKRQLLALLPDALPALLQQLAEQTSQLAKCFVLAGADTDGRNDASFAPDAVRAVNDLRHDYDEACNEAEKLRAKLAERDAEVATLREAFALKHAAIILMRDVANGHKARAEAAEHAREEVERDALLMARWISNLRLEPWQEVDQACEQCRPGGEIVKAGFICGRHTAAAFLAANGGRDG